MQLSELALHAGLCLWRSSFTVWEGRGLCLTSDGLNISKFPVPGKPHDDRVENGCEEQSEDCHAEHSAEHRDAQRKRSRPAPFASTNGTTPRMKAKEVIKIGRRRKRQAWMVASILLAPWS